jgi:mannosylglycerate hydrolase
MATLHLVTHTHWDREWYRPYQEFRLKLVHLVDNLLDLLAGDPEFKHFMLDGQTIILEDYLQVRPEREDELRQHVKNGRLLIGPWYVLPDEFLVSPEALLRNLLEGERTARRFGAKMHVGYIPDPFGHISQMPQILRGFDMSTASLQRGPDEQPCEFWWQSPDGSRVLLAYLRDSYSNAASIPMAGRQETINQLEQIRDSLLPHAASSHLLLMHGNDHTEPSPQTSAIISALNEVLERDRLVHSTLPAYLTAVQAEIEAYQLQIPTYEGELRSSKRHHLLPGVLSTRVWIKQRNHACETLLEKWAEPSSVWAKLATGPKAVEYISNQAALLRQAWRYLMECHPHDSICGCSIDQVHAEMRPRFDQVMQIGEEISRQNLQALADSIDTAGSRSNTSTAVVVFNPVSGPRTDEASFSLHLPANKTGLRILDRYGQRMSYRLGAIEEREVANFTLSREHFMALLGQLRDGQISGMGMQSLVFQEVNFERSGNTLEIQIYLSENGEPDNAALSQGMLYLIQALQDDSLKRFHVRGVLSQTQVHFTAQDIPGYGYKTFWIERGLEDSTQETVQSQEDDPQALMIENQFFELRIDPQDGSLQLTDKRDGAIYSGLNRFVDGGDCGDEYNYSPPAQDRLVSAQVASIQVGRSPARQSIQAELRLEIPRELAPDRQRRSTETVAMRVSSQACLVDGLARVDFQTVVENQAKDHRLRVHFPAPFAVQSAQYDGHFEIVQRITGVPDFDERWGEQPRPEHPQRAFVFISNGKTGLAIANRGLREVAVLSETSPAGNSEIALTLLRCVGWLSRDDFSTRKSHAGPGLPTPGAQMPGVNRFEYAVILSGENPVEGSLYAQAFRFNAPLKSCITGLHVGDLAPEDNFIACEPQDFILSAVKESEDGSGWILRGYNISTEDIQVVISSRVPFKRVWRANLAERQLAELEAEQNGRLVLPLGAHEILTLKFK